MFKLVFVVAFLAAISAQSAMPSFDEMKASLIKEGFSDTAAQGLAEITDKYRSQYTAAQGNPELVRKATEMVKADSASFIATQSEADQAAWKAFIEKQEAGTSSA